MDATFGWFFSIIYSIFLGILIIVPLESMSKNSSIWFLCGLVWLFIFLLIFSISSGCLTFLVIFIVCWKLHMKNYRASGWHHSLSEWVWFSSNWQIKHGCSAFMGPVSHLHIFLGSSPFRISAKSLRCLLGTFILHFPWTRLVASQAPRDCWIMCLAS